MYQCYTEVGNADVACQTSINHLFQLTPRILKTITILQDYFFVRVTREQICAVLKLNRPMDQVKVDVF